MQALTDKLKFFQDCEDQEKLGDTKVLQWDLNTLLEQENLKWKQCAKCYWYCEGDRNTQFSHACADQRRKKTFIRRLDINNNEVIEDEPKIAIAFQDYFSKLFYTSSPSKDDIERSSCVIRPMVIDAMNEQLVRRYTKEVYEALMQMGPMKSQAQTDSELAFIINTRA